MVDNNTSISDTTTYNSSANNASAYNDNAYHASAYHASTYDTSAFVPTPSEDVSSVDIFKKFAWIIIVLSLAAFIYGVTSWCIIKKFRHVRNYVLINVMFANVLRSFAFLFYKLFLKRFCLYLLCETFIFNGDGYEYRFQCVNFFKYLFLYCVLTFDCWLLVLSYIFYVDFVKIFNIDISKRYLKSSMFGWGVPFILVFLYYLAGWLLDMLDSKETLTIPIGMSLLLIPVTISLIIYVIVVYSLFRGSEACAGTTTNRWRRFYIATLIFILSDIIVLYAAKEIFDIKPNLIELLGASGELLNSIALVIYFIIGKSNRKLWREFLNRRLVQKSLEIM